MKRLLLQLILFLLVVAQSSAQERRPIDSEHPMWLVHVDVWNKADPQKIINLIPEKIRPYVVMNLSLSCQYDKEKNVYKMPQNAVRTYKSWASVCQANGMWFTCQPASGGHTHIQDDDLETFEYFYKRYPNFLGWNYAEQFWGFDEPNDKSSSSQASRIALFAKLVPMAHKYGGFLTVSFCGNIWSHPLNPVGMMKRNKDLLQACRDYPEAMLWLYKYTTSSCFYNNESVTFSPFISGLAKNYGVRYDNCGWNGALDALLGEKHGKKYPVAAGIGTVMEQTCVNGGAVWDGPELIWTEDFQNLSNSTVSGYTRRNWGTFPGFNNIWLDMFEKIIDGGMYIPSREEVVKKTKIAVVNNVTSGNDEQKYAAWGDLYDGLYKQTDPFNRGNGQWMDNFCYFKRTGRYGTIPVAVELYDDLAKSIPVKVNKSNYTTRWSSLTAKQNDFNKQYEEVSTGDMFVNRYKNQLVTYTPFTYMNKKKTSSAKIPLLYNNSDSLYLTWGKLSSALVHEHAYHIDFYLNNYRTDTTVMVNDEITLVGVKNVKPTYTVTKRVQARATVTEKWDEEHNVYTLSVSHMGPVDLTIYNDDNLENHVNPDDCGKRTDYVRETALLLPKQPEEFRGTVIIEAEDMDYKSINSCVTDPYGWYPNVRGHAGNGFMDMGTNTAGALKHVLNVKHAGEYKVALRYTSSTKSGSISASIAGVRKVMSLKKTAVNEWQKVVVTAQLKEGDNTMIFSNLGGTPAYIDNVSYTPVEVEDELFGISVKNADHGTVVASAEEAAEGETVTLTVTPDEGFKLVGWTIIHGDIKIKDDNTFVMPDDNVTLQPIFQDMTSVYELDYSNVLAGTLPAGWVAEQENSETHSYPNSYSSGARVFAGFSGYQGKALYWREKRAEYGKQAAYPLSLTAGKYKLTFAMAAWKESPRYKAQIVDASGNIVAESASLLASPNANGNAAAYVGSAKRQELEFEVEKDGKYSVRFISMDVISGYDEFLLLECKVNSVLVDTGILEQLDKDAEVIAIYDMNGVKQSSLSKGVNIVKMSNGINKKVFIK